MTPPRPLAVPAYSYGEMLVKTWGEKDLDNKTALENASGEKVSYGQLRDCLSAEPGPSRRLILFSNSIPAVESYMRGIANPGQIFLVSPRTPPEKIREMVDAFLVEQVEGPLQVLTTLFDTVQVAGGDWGIAMTGALSEQRRSKRITVMMGTSGSTGSSKFVRLDSSALWTNASGISERLGLNQDDVAITALPLSYSYGLSVLNSTLVQGGRVVLGDFDLLSRDFRNVLDTKKVSHLSGVPQSHEMYSRLGIFDHPPRSLKSVTQAGGRLSPEKVRSFALGLSAWGVGFFPMYGQTEATARMTILDSSLAADYPDSVGTVLPSGMITAGSPGSSDEIVYRGPNVMLGYANPGLDDFEQDECSGQLFTGDTGELVDGLLFVKGRLKRIIKISGARLDLDFVEESLRKVCEVAVVGSDERLHVLAATSNEKVISELLEVMGKMEIRRRDVKVSLIPQIMYTPSGKKNYPAMLDQAAED